MNKKNIVIILLVIVITIAIVTLYGTFASDTTANNSDDTYNITLTGSTENIIVPANSSKTIIYRITNTNKGKVQYGIAYSGTGITVRMYNDSEDQESGLIDYGENKFIKLYISNNSNTESTATLKTILGYENGGDLIIPSGYTLVTEIYPTPMPLREYITNLYNNASKTTVTNNSIEYNYATSVSLMNDRLGGTTADYDAGNIRYYGADPNNYIDIGDVYEKDITINNWEKFDTPFTESSECYAYFDCSTNYAEIGFEDEASCIAWLPIMLEEEFSVSSVGDICGTTTIPKGTPKLYRIIGLFKDVELADGTKQDLVKIVRNNSIGGYSWNSLEDSSTSTSSLSNSSNSKVNLLVSDGKYKSQFLVAPIEDGSINDWNVSS